MSNIVGNYFRLGPRTETRALARGSRGGEALGAGGSFFTASLRVGSTCLRVKGVVTASAELLVRARWSGARIWCPVVAVPLTLPAGEPTGSAFWWQGLPAARSAAPTGARWPGRRQRCRLPRPRKPWRGLPTASGRATGSGPAGAGQGVHGVPIVSGSLVGPPPPPRGGHGRARVSAGGTHGPATRTPPREAARTTGAPSPDAAPVAAPAVVSVCRSARGVGPSWWSRAVSLARQGCRLPVARSWTPGRHPLFRVRQADLGGERHWVPDTVVTP